MALDFGEITITGINPVGSAPVSGQLDYGEITVTGIDATGTTITPVLTLTFLKPEFCRFEQNFKTLKVRVKINDMYDPGKDNIFTAKIISALGMEYPIDTWTETININTTKLIKEYDLNLVTFAVSDDCDLPLNLGKHTLQISLNNTVVSEQFDVVPITVQSIKNQYMLGVNMEANAELVIQQDLRLITGVNVVHISKETPVGSKELVWNAADQTLQWDNGEPIPISDDYIEYHLMNYMGSSPGITDGDYLKVEIEDIDELPQSSETEIVIVDIKRYDIKDFQYWVNNAYRVVTETMIMTDIEPTLYSSNKELGYKYLDPVMNLPKPFTESSNHSFEFPINMLQCIVELWAHYRGAGAGGTRINIDLNRVEFSTDSQVVVRGFPYDVAFSGNTATIGLAGLWDRTIHAKSHHGARNKTKNFWQGTVVAGIVDKELQALALDVCSKIAAVDLYVQSGLGRGAGIASRSFSVGGISSSYNTVESAENALLSSSILEIQRRLGVGRATKDEQKTGMVQQLKSKVLGGALGFKY